MNIRLHVVVDIQGCMDRFRRSGIARRSRGTVVFYMTGRQIWHDSYKPDLCNGQLLGYVFVVVFLETPNRRHQV